MLLQTPNLPLLSTQQRFSRYPFCSCCDWPLLSFYLFLVKFLSFRSYLYDFTCFYSNSFLINKRYLHGEVDPWIRSIVKQIVVKRDESHEKRNDFLQTVLDMRERKEMDLDDTSIVGISLSFLTDGFDLSGGLIAYCFYRVHCDLTIYFVNVLNVFIHGF